MCDFLFFKLFIMLYLVVLLQIVHLVYHQVTTLVDFYPFNNIRAIPLRMRLIESGVNLVTMGFPIVAFLSGDRGWMKAGLFFYGFLLFGEFMSWWRHYLFGPTPEWRAMYDSSFKETIKVLPAIKDHPVPNLEHTILHGLSLITFLVSLGYYWGWV